jgi:hypothetical protein
MLAWTQESAMPPQFSFAESARRYEARREEARAHTQNMMYNLAMNLECPLEAARIDLISINHHALEEADGWELPWRQIVGQLTPYLRRFEVAIWFEGHLYGLGIGRASRGKKFVCVHYLERRPGENPFAGWISLMVLDAAENYGKILGSQCVRIRNPRQGVVRKYESLGFSLAETYRGATYYERRVS